MEQEERCSLILACADVDDDAEEPDSTDDSFDDLLGRLMKINAILSGKDDPKKG